MNLLLIENDADDSLNNGNQKDPNVVVVEKNYCLGFLEANLEDHPNQLLEIDINIEIYFKVVSKTDNFIVHDTNTNSQVNIVNNQNEIAIVELKIGLFHANSNNEVAI